MNTALPITAKTQNTQQIQNTEPCQLDKEVKADKAKAVDKTNKVNEADKSIVLTPLASAASPLQPSPELRILRIKEVAKKLSIGQSTIYDWLNKKSPRYDETFPKPIKLSSKSIGWLSTEIDAWLLAKAEQTRVSDFG